MGKAGSPTPPTDQAHRERQQALGITPKGRCSTTVGSRCSRIHSNLGKLWATMVVTAAAEIVRNNDLGKDQLLRDAVGHPEQGLKVCPAVCPYIRGLSKGGCEVVERQRTAAGGHNRRPEVRASDCLHDETEFGVGLLRAKPVNHKIHAVLQAAPRDPAVAPEVEVGRVALHKPWLGPAEGFPKLGDGQGRSNPARTALSFIDHGIRFLSCSTEILPTFIRFCSLPAFNTVIVLIRGVEDTEAAEGLHQPHGLHRVQLELFPSVLQC